MSSDDDNAAREKVDQYQKTTKTGKVVTVSSYERNNNEVAVAVAADPTRPPLAAKMGTFAAGRAIPGIWNDPLKHQVTNPLVDRTATPDDRIQEAINDEANEKQIRDLYGVSSKVSKEILIAIKEKKAQEGNG